MLSVYQRVDLPQFTSAILNIISYLSDNASQKVANDFFVETDRL